MRDELENIFGDIEDFEPFLQDFNDYPRFDRKYEWLRRYEPFSENNARGISSKIAIFSKNSPWEIPSILK